jgi:membrane associated rhomboid family serine protease
MARTSSTTLSLPPFTGATRQLMLWNIASFFVLAIMMWVSPRLYQGLLAHLAFSPQAVSGGQIWQLVTYAFVNLGLLSTFLSMIVLWYLGFYLETSFGPRFLYEVYFTSAIGGALLATAISYTHLFGLTPAAVLTGQSAAMFGLLIAINQFFGDQDILFMFVLRMKIRYLVAISILLYLAKVLVALDRFDALVALCGGLAGYLYVRFAPRKGFGFSLAERYYALRNEYYRAKRRRAAKKFEVYMKKQNRDVHFDSNGRYVAPEDKNPDDKRWMN